MDDRKRGGGGAILGLAVVVVATVMVVAGVVPRIEQRRALARMQRQAEAPRPVRAEVVKPGSPRAEITLPGTTTPFYSTALYARSLGFLRRNLVEVGDRVRRGQLLAEIAAPESDEDVRLARAQLDEAAQNVGIVQRNAERSTKLSEVGVVSRETADVLRAQANSAVASLRTRRAALKRASALRGYQRIEAPFDGVITRRNFDPGALVGAGGTGALPLFEVAQTSTLRVFVDVPQSLAAGVVPGVEASVVSPAAPAEAAAGRVIRTSVVLDASTRTLRTEINVPGDGRILPGAFVYVKLTLPRKVAPPAMPGAALIVRKEGTLAARLDGATVRLVPVQVGRDLGKEVEVLRGLGAGDRVVVSPPDDLADGAAVQVVDSDRAHGTHG